MLIKEQSMGMDSRDVIWESTFDLYYDCYFQELLIYGLSGRWIKIDIVVRILMAATASGSTISGWALWEDPTYKTLWSFIACFTAILTIVYLTLNVAEKVKTYTQTHKDFLSLRHRLYQLRNDQAIDPDFPIEEMNDKLKEYRSEYSAICSQTSFDILKTTRLENTTQDEINSRLADITQGGS